MGKTRVLLVDDEQEFVSTLAERLELRGFSVQTAPDGETALQTVQRERPHVVVLDLKMPGLSGTDVLSRMREQSPGLPVILLSGYGSTRDGIEGMRLGAFDFMLKPVDIDVLLAKIAEAVGGANETEGSR